MNAVMETDELEALFEEVAARSAAQAARPDGQETPLHVTESTVADAGHSAAAARGSQGGPPDSPSSNAAAPAAEPEEVFQKIGQLTRVLHDALRELGYDRAMQDAMESLPDARDRLEYVATLTGRAAERVLGAVERAQAVNVALRQDASRLESAWERVYSGAADVDEFKSVAAETRGFLRQATERSDEADSQLHEIMMAQDFHDLTGQVIQRVTGIAKHLEQQLVKLLIEATPPERRRDEGFLTGPAMRAGERDDVISGQAGVDDLLESLGF